ncbi:hypothetical protein AVEN_113097-1 [Araneus ventricosus]|uniref:Ig-like domain-containing protein n=1 Tax=Araneus ventricosus TaxID=182803 RepID=A0A4Y2N869_ARAVE|nr:hypothetical protein AVEN_113097-1 [Araneus ventricosus]
MSQVHKRVPFHKYIAGDAVKFNRYKEKQHFYSQAVLSPGYVSTHAPEPEFIGGIPGIKVIAGKDAILRCVVENLGDYKVSWGVVNQKDQLSIGTNVFKGKDRIHVTHSDNSWYLHIKNVTQNDTGYYICQISTNPIKTQAGHLDVVGICKILMCFRVLLN